MKTNGLFALFKSEQQHIDIISPEKSANLGARIYWEKNKNVNLKTEWLPPSIEKNLFLFQYSIMPVYRLSIVNVIVCVLQFSLIALFCSRLSFV